MSDSFRAALGAEMRSREREMRRRTAVAVAEKEVPPVSAAVAAAAAPPSMEVEGEAPPPVQVQLTIRPAPRTSVRKDFFGRVIPERPAVEASASTSDTTKRAHEVAFKFNEGVGDAVKRVVLMRELVKGV